MLRSNVKRTGKTNDQIHEAPVPVLLRITLLTLLALGAVPARLRRARAGWLLSASPSLVPFLRLIAVVANIVTISAIILDFESEPKLRIRVGTTTLSKCLCIVVVFLVVTMHSLAVSAGLDMRQMITMLQEIHKIKNSLDPITVLINKRHTQQALLTFYVIWTTGNHLATTCKMVYTYVNPPRENPLVASFTVVMFYQSLVSTMTQLHWSMAMEEIISTLTFINDKLESLLKRTTDSDINSEYVCRSIRLLHVSYDTICELLRRHNDHYGKFLCFHFFFLFICLLIVPFNILVVIELKDAISLVELAIWAVEHFIQLMVLVEPFHRLQGQKDRTKRVLSALADQATRRRQSPLHLKPFILQLRMLDSPLTLCDTFTMSRSVLASVIGGVVSYLIIILQVQSTTERL